MLTVRDIARMPGLGLTVVAGAKGVGNEVGWLVISEEDLTRGLEILEESLVAAGGGS